jgi:hypothetical protein
VHDAGAAGTGQPRPDQGCGPPVLTTYAASSWWRSCPSAHPPPARLPCGLSKPFPPQNCHPPSRFRVSFLSQLIYRPNLM